MINMRKLLIPVLVLVSLSFTACGGGKASAADVAKKWCELNGKYHKAEGGDKDVAEAALKDYEQAMEKKYDKDFMKEVEKEVNKCEAASEGR
jgi:hypothetical protein